MALILNIDTATDSASVCLSQNGEPLCMVENVNQTEHAAWLHVAVETMMRNTHHVLTDLDAVAVTEGPGSYTGLRVGMAAAKGFCYALQIPFITESTLKVMALAASLQKGNQAALLCPMIDARRNEVFTAIYTNQLETVFPPTAMVLNESSFAKVLGSDPVLFFGSGSIKWKKLTVSPGAVFADISSNAGNLAVLSFKKFANMQFTDIIYSQPAYLKDFHFYIEK